MTVVMAWNSYDVAVKDFGGKMEDDLVLAHDLV